VSDTSGTFGGWSDRLTYLLAEGQLLVAGLAVSVGILLLWLKPSLPGIPPVVGGIFAALLLLGPPLLGLFVTGARALRRRSMVTVYHVNAVTDTLKKYYVSPELWAEKNVEGPTPYPVNGGSAWAVREWSHQEDVGELTVRGVWLSEAEDVDLMTSKSHMNAVYEKLTESHLALKVMRDSVSELSADIQGRLINRMAEAREKGRMMDPDATKEVFESFESEVQDMGTDDLPTLDHEDLPGPDLDDLAEQAVEEIDAPDPAGGVGMGGEQPTAADGGSTDD